MSAVFASLAFEERVYLVVEGLEPKGVCYKMTFSIRSTRNAQNASLNKCISYINALDVSNMRDADT